MGGSPLPRSRPRLPSRPRCKLITVHAGRIAINALRNALDAEKILTWLQGVINDTWERRREIEPSFQAAPQPQVLTILRLLPKSNCGRCGLATCMVFAAQAAEGGLQAEQCPELDAASRQKLAAYLGRFRFDW